MVRFFLRCGQQRIYASDVPAFVSLYLFSVYFLVCVLSVCVSVVIFHFLEKDILSILHVSF